MTKNNKLPDDIVELDFEHIEQTIKKALDELDYNDENFNQTLSKYNLAYDTLSSLESWILSRLNDHDVQCPNSKLISDSANKIINMSLKRYDYSNGTFVYRKEDFERVFNELLIQIKGEV